MEETSHLILNSVNHHHEERKHSRAIASVFSADEEDIQPINGLTDFFTNFYIESVKLWYLAGPAIFAAVCQYSLGGFTQVMAGQVGTIELAAVSVSNSVVAGFAFGIMWGMGSALETLCGQAYGAGQVHMLGIYMQRSWIILLTTCLPLMFLYIFATQILIFVGQTPDISRWAGIFSIWMIPQLFAFALNFPIEKFLQSQSKIMAMAAISAVAVVAHVFFSWLLMLKLGWGLVGGAVVLNASWWFVVVAQFLYIIRGGACGEAWNGFSWMAFQDLWGFVKLSLASAIMLCLEFWYMTALILFAGNLKNAEIAVNALSICMNILGWTIMISMGFHAAISVRVSNELGAGHPRTAKFSVVVVAITSVLFGTFLAVVLFVFRKQYPALFSASEDVQKLVHQLTPLLATSIITDSVQPTLSGVAVGAGWQAFVAYVNIVCYYVIGIPLGLIMGFTFDLGVEELNPRPYLKMPLQGIWYGMLAGTVAQTSVLLWMVIKTNWNKEASIARERIKEWGGKADIELTST